MTRFARRSCQLSHNRFGNAAFELGWKISLVCALLFIGFTIPYYSAQAKKGKYEK